MKTLYINTISLLESYINENIIHKYNQFIGILYLKYLAEMSLNGYYNNKQVDDFLKLNHSKPIDIQ